MTNKFIEVLIVNDNVKEQIIKLYGEDYLTNPEYLFRKKIADEIEQNLLSLGKLENTKEFREKVKKTIITVCEKYIKPPKIIVDSGIEITSDGAIVYRANVKEWNLKNE